MTTTRLPRHSPFLQFTRVGLPYHGFVDGINAVTKIGLLTLPDSTEKNYPQSINGDVVLVRGNGYSTTEETVDGNHRWRNYALLSGNTRRIGGQDVGPYSWIYSDGSRCWVVSAEIYQAPADNDVTISVYLESLFGLLHDRDLTFERILLDSLTFVPKKYNGDSVPAATTISSTFAGKSNTYAGARTMSHSEDGAVSIVNLAGHLWWMATGVVLNDAYVRIYGSPLSTTYDEIEEIFDGSYETGSYGYHTSVKIALSGIGSTATGTIGSGISAAITLHREAPDRIVVATWEQTSYTYTVLYTHPTEGWIVYQVIASGEGNFSAVMLDVAMPDGTVSQVVVSAVGVHSQDFKYSEDQYYWLPDWIGNMGEEEVVHQTTTTVTFGAFSEQTSDDYYYYNPAVFGEDETTIYTQDGFDLVANDVSRLNLTVAAIADRSSLTKEADTEYPNYDTSPDILPYAADAVQGVTSPNKTYGSMVYLTGPRPKLLSLISGESADVSIPDYDWREEWALVGGRNCSHNPITGEFWYDIYTNPSYYQEAEIGSSENLTAGSFV